MVQGFTGKSDDLLEAVNTLLTAKSPLYTSEAQKQRDSDRVAYLGRMYGRGSGLSSLVDRLQKSLDAENAHNENIRARVTIASLESLARAVSGYPGRKNLLWLSGDFPFRFGPDITDEYAIVYRQAVQRLSALLASAQIAVYPIDVRGLYSRGVDMSSKAEGPEPNTAVGTLNTTQKFDDRQNKENFRTHSIMSDVARETGGQAYWGSNDLKRAFAKAINGGANYYTLTYTPESIKWDGSYRHLEVKLNRPGAKLVYRRGYYAVPDEEATGDQVSRLLAAAMQPTTPESTSIIMVVKVSGQGRSDGVVSIDYAIDPRNVSTPPASDGKNSLKLDLMAVAFSEGRDVLQTASRLEGPVGADELKDALNRGIQAHQELKLGPGKYMVRLGVVDRNSTRIGTLDVPIEIPAVQAGK
jgi:VWFA-related protein